MPEFRNESGLEFADISSEEFREYIPLKDGEPFRISGPLWIAFKSGTHRVFDAEGFSYHIDLDRRLVIRWKAKEGRPHFVK